MDQAAWAAHVRAQMNFEWKREGPPEDFPALPPIPTGRYTDPDFYAFVRSLEAYRKTIGKNTTLVLSPNAEFFQFFEGASPSRKTEPSRR